jgi:hypothetical protein
LNVPTIWSVLFVRSTANGVTFCSAAPRSYRLTPAQAQNGMAHSPIEAPSRAFRASLGAGAVRYSFTVTDFHRLPFAGLPAHPSTTSKAASRAALRLTT